MMELVPHTQKACYFLKEKGADVGLAFDGDGDRLIAIDEKGNIVDGDQIMYICAKYLKEQGRLKHGTVVSTVMSNLGFYKGIRRHMEYKVYKQLLGIAM